MAPILATILILAGLGVFLWTIGQRVRPLLFARPEVRWDDPQERTARLLEYGFGQERLPGKAARVAGSAHVLIFVAFLLAQLGTMTSFGQAYYPEFQLPLLNAGNWLGRGYLLAKDLISVVGTVGVAVFLW